jgi:hypothetical protein
MRGALRGVFRRYRGGVMQDLGYELPRIETLRSKVNKGEGKGQG